MSLVRPPQGGSSYQALFNPTGQAKLRLRETLSSRTQNFHLNMFLKLCFIRCLEWDLNPHLRVSRPPLYQFVTATSYS